jgi:hypothetical protein
MLWGLAVAAALLLAWLGIARAHMAEAPEMNEWLMAQRNQNGGMCCSGGDTIELSDSEWGTENGRYWVVFNGKKTSVEPWMLTSDPRNKLPNALLWVWDNHPQCFKPATFY